MSKILSLNPYSGVVVAADNILMFSFQEFVDFAKEKGTSCIMCHEQPSIERLQRTGVVVLAGCSIGILHIASP